MKITEDIKREMVERLVAANPELAGYEPGPFSRIFGGADTTIYGFDMKTDNESIPLIIRLYQPLHAATGKKEFVIMNQAYAMGVRVPQTYLLVEDSKAANTAYLVMERIEGKTLGETLQERAGSPGIESLLQTFMRDLAGIHALDWREGFAFLDRQDIASNPDVFYENEFKYAKTRVNDHDITELKRVVTWLEENKIAIEDPCLLHSDYHPMNILVTPTDELVIIDWANTKIGDYRYDLAFAVMSLRSMGLGTDQLVPVYESYAKKKVENLEYFAVLASLWNLLRIYSAVFDHGITGENKETERLFATEYNFYAQEVVRTTQETTGVDLSALLKALGG